MPYSEKKYYDLSTFAKTYNYGTILDDIEKYFGYLHNKDEMDDIGLKLQVSIKKSRPMYLHGYVISSALYNYLLKNNYNNINILETGTARGFSCIVMARIMEMHNIEGTIYTIDNNDVFNNCLKAAQLNREVSVNECLEEWKLLVDKYIIFEKGNSNEKLQELNNKLSRIHFAFLDGAHYYNEVTKELNFVENRQEIGDIIICDDYTEKQFPEIVRAVNNFLENGKYESNIFYGNDGSKNRGYVYMKRIID